MLAEAVLQEAVLQGVVLQGVVLQEVVLQGVVLQGVVLQGVVLLGVMFNCLPMFVKNPLICLLNINHKRTIATIKNAVSLVFFENINVNPLFV